VLGTNDVTPLSPGGVCPLPSQNSHISGAEAVRKKRLRQAISILFLRPGPFSNAREHARLKSKHAAYQDGKITKMLLFHLELDSADTPCLSRARR
jgi:hypothetical protein